MNRKSLLFILLITFGIAWILFSLPLAFKNAPNYYLTVKQICFMVVILAPGIAVLIATRFVEKQPVIQTLRLNKLGSNASIWRSGSCQRLFR